MLEVIELAAHDLTLIAVIPFGMSSATYKQRGVEMVQKLVIFGGLVASAAVAQEKGSGQGAPPASPLVCAASMINKGEPAVNYGPSDVQILGDLEDGQTSKPVVYSPKPPYRAFVFSGYGCEKVEVTVNSKDGTPFLALADSSLNEISRGDSHLSIRLPYRGPDIEVWYIVFKDVNDKPASFTVQVKKTETFPQIMSSETTATK